ncbi:MAG: cysteine--tRNA ligase [Acidimicrobiia bacterium]
MLHLHDTALGQVAALRLREEGRVSMYVCGPTVYGPPHLGHGRFSLVFDVLRRYLEWSGLGVTYVSNITDIDDKIIARAVEEGRPAAEVAVEYEAVWYDAMEGLNVRRPDHDPHATAYVDHMVDLVAGLEGAGAAYSTSDGVYLAVENVPGYGLLARQSLDSLKAGAGERAIVGSDEKRSPLDFALWKLAKPDEPSWPSPWGAGRPGWHTECVVMSLDLLGDGFDIHGGGQDLAFPHHENERAQAVAAGRTFARHWAHNGFVVTGGEKMSKSLGNVMNLTELLATSDPRAYRLLVLQSHWRAPVDVTEASVEAAVNALSGLDDFARRTTGLPSHAAADAALLARFRERMDDDLDTPGAMAAVFEGVRAANRALDAGDNDGAARLAAAVREAASAVGLPLAGKDVAPPEVTALVERREAARKARDWAASDALRDEIGAAGWAVEDTPQGPRVHRRP